METHGMPLIQQVLLDLTAPPILALLWWLFSRTWAGIVQGGSVSDMTKLRQSKMFWVVLSGLYAIMFGATAYYHL